MQSPQEIRQTLVLGRQFEVVLEPENGGGYHAYCPELRGCHTYGRTVDEAIQHIAEAVTYHLNELVQRFGRMEGIATIPGENIIPPGVVAEKTLRAIVADMGMSLEEFLALLEGQEPPSAGQQE